MSRPASPTSARCWSRSSTTTARASCTSAPVSRRLAEPGIALLYCTDDSPDGDFDDVSAGDRPFTVRWALHYLNKEYARHLGHADLLRERIDGAVGE